MCCRVLANALFPNWLVTMMLLGLLIFLTYKTGKKAVSLHRREVRYLAQREEHPARHASGKDGQSQDKREVQRGAEPANAVRLGEPLPCVRQPGRCMCHITRKYNGCPLILLAGSRRPHEG